MNISLVKKGLLTTIILVISFTLGFSQKVNWAKHINPESTEYSDITGIVKKGEFIYYVGHSDSQTQIDSDNSNEVVGRGVFLVKSTSEGQIVWSSEILTSYREDQPWNKRQLNVPNDIFISEDGSIIISGTFRNTLTFNGVDDQIVINADQTDGRNHEHVLLPFVAKFNAQGQALIVKVISRPIDVQRLPDVYIGSMEASPSGDLYISGNYRFGTIFNFGEPNETTLLANDGRSGEGFFLAKYNQNLELVWVKHIHGNNNANPDFLHNSSLAVGQSNIYMAVTFQGVLTIESGNSSSNTIGSGLDNSFGGIAGAIIGMVLSKYGYDGLNPAAIQGAIPGIKMLMSWVPGIVAVIGACIMMFYPLTKTKMGEITSELEQRRLKAAATAD